MKNWTEYLKLKEEKPFLFTKEELEIILDEKTIIDFEKSTGREIGILYQSPYRRVLVDLVKNSEGKLFAYERIIPAKTGAAAVLPIYDDKVILIKQYRHPAQTWFWEIPRGFGENISAMENAVKELFEETGIKSANFIHLGQIAPDSGLTSDNVAVFLAEIKDANLSLSNKEETEVISNIRMFSLEEIKQMITNGIITDSFTLAAIGLWRFLTQ